jgi:hypothetical protein
MKAKKAPAAEKPEAKTVIGTAEVAKRLKLDPKTLRKHLRAISGKAPGTRYEWEENDPFLKKLPDLIKAQEEKEEAKKAAKK